MRIKLHTLFWLILLSFAFQFTWELAQSPLYTCSGDGVRCFWICFRATLGDLGITLVLFGVHQKVPSLLGMALIGAVIAAAIEKISLLMERWTYLETMPTLPILDVGITPVLQMALIPPLIFYILKKNL